MADEKNKLSMLQIICLAIGIFTGVVLVQFVFGLGGALGGALGGGLGALLGFGLAFVIGKITNKS
jgi:hypothetical protein